jgi:uncharacterized glyoxalase superfamily protein PhnB
METTQLITGMMPRLVVDDAAAAIEFYVRALGAVEQERHEFEGRIVHARLSVGEMSFAVKDRDDVDPSPKSLGGNAVIISLDVTDSDAAAARMVDARASVVFAVDDHACGFKDGRLEDPFGHLWLVSQPL